jgi:hypothetical protein
LWGRGQCNNHHPKQCEVNKAHEYEVVEPQELCSRPLEAHHGEKENAINNSLYCYINCFYGHLQEIILSA